jgi:hypothetical protein
MLLIVSVSTDGRERTSWAIARFPDEIDSEVLFAEELTVLLAHPVHAFAGSFHPLGTVDALHEIIEGLPQLGFDVFGDASDGLGRVQGLTPLPSV